MAWLRKELKMLRNIPLFVLLIGFSVPPGEAQAVHNSKEYSFFRVRFEQVNADKEKDLNETFDAVSEAVKDIQRSAPNVTLGGMLALVIFEGGARLGFFNTKDAENSFNPAKRIPNVPKLDSGVPFSQQPLARYSYQFGIVPIHTSIFRPCLAGTQHARKLFDTIAQQQGFAPTTNQLASVRKEFDQVCQKAHKPIADGPRAVDFYILNAHTRFAVPVNRVGGDVGHISDFPLYAPRVTTPFFFAAILAHANQNTDDRAAICLWGGGDKNYCNAARQNQILAPWSRYADHSASEKGQDH
jgi:hypothetical protein